MAAHVDKRAVARTVATGLFIMGLLALAAGTALRPDVVVWWSPDGVLSVPFVRRLNAMRLLALAAGSAVVLGATWWRWRRLSVTLLALAGSLGWSVVIVSQVYPHHLLFQPARVARVALGEELLLSDYDPQPKLVVPTHEVMQARYPVINIHTHFRRWREQRTPEQLIALMDACNVQRLVDLDGDLGEKLQQEIAQYAQRYPERLTIFATFGFQKGTMDWGAFPQRVALLDEAKAMGARGIKIWKNLGLYTVDEDRRVIPIDDPRLEPLWAKAEALGLPILIHVADLPANFDALDRHNERYEFLKANLQLAYHGPQAPRPDAILAQFERVLERHPHATFILAHLANRTDDLRVVGGMLDRHPNLSMDISARIQELGRQPRAAREFFLRYQDRLLFATDGNPGAEVYRAHFRFLETADDYFDYPFWGMFNFGRWKIYGVDLPDEVLRKLYHDNAAAILGLPRLAEEPAVVEGEP